MAQNRTDRTATRDRQGGICRGNKARDRAGVEKPSRDMLGWQGFRGVKGSREGDKFGKEAEGDGL